MNGSEKQVAWAIQIRDKRLAEVDAKIAEFLDEETRKGNELAEEHKAARELLTQKDDAAWWIDNKGMNITILLMPFRAQVKAGK